VTLNAVQITEQIAGMRFFINIKLINHVVIHSFLISLIFINGKEIWWGHEAPKEGIREAISQALRHK